MKKGSVNWEYFNKFLAYHELHSFAYTCFKEHGVLLPSDEEDLLKKTHYFVLARLAEQENEFLLIADIFRDQGLDLLPLKGSAFLIDNLYADKAGLRPMVDIDVLVKNEKFPQAERLLETLGYRKDLGGFKEDYWKKKNYHIAFVKQVNGKKLPGQLEMHWLLDYPGKISLLPMLWGRIRKLKFGKREISLLSPEDTLFCLALHLRRFGNVLSLKSACDFARLLSQYKYLDWDYILKEAENGQLRACLYFRLIQASLLFNIRVPDSMLNNLCLANYKRRLIGGFILQNTFLGTIETTRSNFLKNHFLVYDHFWEPVSMIINMPQEQFAKFYRLAPYSMWTFLWYRLRFLYFPYYLFVLVLKAIIRKIAIDKAIKQC